MLQDYRLYKTGFPVYISSSSKYLVIMIVIWEDRLITSSLKSQAPSSVSSPYAAFSRIPKLRIYFSARNDFLCFGNGCRCTYLIINIIQSLILHIIISSWESLVFFLILHRLSCPSYAPLAQLRQRSNRFIFFFIRDYLICPFFFLGWSCRYHCPNPKIIRVFFGTILGFYFFTIPYV